MHCGKSPSEPHHIKGIGGFSGMGLKAPDFLTMPLCFICHAVIHLYGINKEKQAEWALKTITKAVEQGVLEVKG